MLEFWFNMHPIGAAFFLLLAMTAWYWAVHAVAWICRACLYTLELIVAIHGWFYIRRHTT